jgi:hypothetical protein
MRTTAALLIPIAALAVLAVGCTDNRTTAAAPAPYGVSNGVTATAPNVNNPYATDPLDPDMNPHYMRNPRGGGRR